MKRELGSQGQWRNLGSQRERQPAGVSVCSFDRERSARCFLKHGRALFWEPFPPRIAGRARVGCVYSRSASLKFSVKRLFLSSRKQTKIVNSISRETNSVCLKEKKKKKRFRSTRRRIGNSVNAKIDLSLCFFALDRQCFGMLFLKEAACSKCGTSRIDNATWTSHVRFSSAS